MPECQAFGCLNKRGEGLGKGKRFFIIPDGRKCKEKRGLSEKWLHNIGTGHTVEKFNFTKNKLVCEDHFLPNSFEDDIRGRLTGRKTAKILKNDAFPELFVHRKPKEDQDRKSRASKRASQKNVASLLHSSNSDAGPSSPSCSLLSPSSLKRSSPYTDVTSPDTSKRMCNTSLLSPSSFRRSLSQDISLLTSPVSHIVDNLTSPTLGETSSSLSTPLIRRRRKHRFLRTPTANHVSHTSDAGTQTDVIENEKCSCFRKATTLLDHPYASLTEPLTVPLTVSQTIVPHLTVSILPSISIPAYQSKPVPQEKSSIDEDIDNNVPYVDNIIEDPNYVPIEETLNDNCSESSDSEVHEAKYIVFESSLNKLFYTLKCDECFSNFVEIDKSTRGTCLLVTLSCSSGHVMKWQSQPMDDKMPLGNLLTSAAIMYSGLTFQRVSTFSKFLNLTMFSHTTFHDMQNKFLIPEINSTWNTEQSKLIRSLQGNALELSGDGRCDSPGYSAKYCSYSLMDLASDKVVDFELVQVSETGSSVRMEAVAFDKCFSRVLNDHKLSIDKFATDRHVSIRKLMKDKYSTVKHNFDVFHLAKNVSSKLRKIVKKKGNEELEMWTKSISNHLWWCSRNCEKDPKLLVEMWMSLLYHVTGKHEWHDDAKFTAFKTCSHPSLDCSHRKKWIVDGSPAHESLKKVLLNKRLLKDLAHLADFMHTGALEVFHNVVLKYAPKRLEFDYVQMKARLQLAALDHNHNVGRPQAVIKHTRQGSAKQGDSMYKASFSKHQKQWVVKPVYEQKNYDFVQDMMCRVVQRKRNNQIEIIEHTQKPNTAPVPAPPKAELIAKHLSRF